jgi:hypothetical protein
VRSPLNEAFAALQDKEAALRSVKFPVKSRGLTQRIKDRHKKRDAAAVRKLIKPENSDIILDAFPVEPGDQLHAITSGDFIYGDFLLRLMERHGKPESVTITTLSMSQKNAERIASLLKKDPFPLHIVLSDYFKSSNGKIFTAIQNFLIDPAFPGFRLTVTRSHAKIALFKYPEKYFVIESSANLRSSNNIEQISVFQDRELHDFHIAWIEEVILADQTKNAAS